MLCYPHVCWSIVCITTQVHTHRSTEFKSAMEAYRRFGVDIVSYLSLEKVDSGWREPLQQKEADDWKGSLKGLDLKPDIVFTHDKCGDYGHDHHKNVNIIVHSLFSNVMDFAYPGDENIIKCPREDILYSISLAPEIMVPC